MRPTGLVFFILFALTSAVSAQTGGLTVLVPTNGSTLRARDPLTVAWAYRGSSKSGFHVYEQVEGNAWRHVGWVPTLARSHRVTVPDVDAKTVRYFVGTVASGKWSGYGMKSVTVRGGSGGPPPSIAITSPSAGTAIAAGASLSATWTETSISSGTTHVFILTPTQGWTRLASVPIGTANAQGTVPNDLGSATLFVGVADQGAWVATDRVALTVSAASPGGPGGPTGPRKGRSGLVRLAGNTFVDDQGAFLALGTTFFWGAWGYKFDRPKLEAALDLLSKNGFDYIRCLGVVGHPNSPDYWDGREIDWRWPDYDSVIAGLTDLAYDTYGIRVQWTLIGDGQVSIPDMRDRYALADRFLAMSRGREHKIILFEVANEFWQNGFPGSQGVQDLRALSRHLKDRTDILVAASAPGHSDQDVYDVYDGGVADICTIHFDRDTSKTEGSWRPVRQPWEHAFRQPRVPPAINNEPIGPGSSVASENDPIRLVAAAVNTYMCNLPAYVLHSRAGVRGDLDFSTMAGITSFNALKGLLPAEVASWSRKNAHWADSPFRVYAGDDKGNLHADSMWVDHHNAQSGAVRAYGQVNGNDFAVFPIGIRNKVVMEPRRDCEFEVIDPMTGQVLEKHNLVAGQRFELKGADALLLRGRYR